MPGHEVGNDEYEQKQVNADPDGFDSQYLKIYYGKNSIPILLKLTS